jgi:hypothetical protein
VIRRVAGPEIPEVLRLVVAIVRRERAQADRRQQPLADDAHHRLPALARENGMRQGDRQHLVRTALRIVAAPLGIHDVIAISAVGEPAAIVERSLRLIGTLAVPCRLVSSGIV